MKNFKVKKLFGGKMSIRSTIVEKAIAKGEHITVDFNGQLMVLSPEDLRNYTTDGKWYTSNWNNERYQLWDYPWKPTEQLKIF